MTRKEESVADAHPCTPVDGGRVVTAVCGGTRRDGAPCTTVVPADQRHCYHHDPARAEERRRNASRAASAKHSTVGKELRDLRDLIWEIVGLTVSERIPVTVRKRLAEIVQLLQCYLRAVELEIRTAEEPMRPDLDVKGLKAQVKERIEVLEEREREKEEMLARVTEFAEEHGLDAGQLKAGLGG